MMAPNNILEAFLISVAQQVGIEPAGGSEITLNQLLHTNEEGKMVMPLIPVDQVYVSFSS
jgi:ribosomal protein L18E